MSIFYNSNQIKPGGGVFNEHKTSKGYGESSSIKNVNTDTKGARHEL
jgi:hypothetical protein